MTLNLKEVKQEYRNPSISIETRAKDLLSQMTLEEKVAQMTCVWNDVADTLIDENGDLVS